MDSLNQKLSKYYKEVCELRQRNNIKKTENVLFQEVVGVNEVYENATFNINKTCQYLNDCTNQTLKGRISSDAILVGKECAPLFVSLKQHSDNMYKTDINDPGVNTEEILQSTFSKAEDNLHGLEDLCKSTNKFIQSLEYLVKNIGNLDKLDNDTSTVSEISSFLDKDVVTSSPIDP